MVSAQGERSNEEAGRAQRQVLTCFRGEIKSANRGHKVSIPVFPGPERRQPGLNVTLGQEYTREEDSHVLV